MDPTNRLRAAIKTSARNNHCHPIAVLAVAAQLAEQHLRAESENTHLVYQYVQLRRWVDAEIDACLSYQAYQEFN